MSKNLVFKKDQSEEYYRKLLLLEKVKPRLQYLEKQYIFNCGYCHDLLSKDEDFDSFVYHDFIKKGKTSNKFQKILLTSKYYYSYKEFMFKIFKRRINTLLVFNMVAIMLFAIAMVIVKGSFVYFLLDYLIFFISLLGKCIFDEI